MSEVHRFTTRYDVSEDRFQILVEMEGGEVQVLWLTRRLLNNLVPVLLEKLESGPVVKNVPAPKSQAVQKFAQAAAVGGLKKQKSVTPPTKTSEEPSHALITSVDLKVSQRALSLTFKSGQTLAQSLQLTEPALRQWLGIIHKQYQAAGWSEALWPAWMLVDSQESPSDLRLN